MHDVPYFRPPELSGILADSAGIGFAMSCEDRTGSILATLAASKPGGRFVELGGGTGAGAAWLAMGMDADARLTTVEVDPAVQDIARRHLGTDPRIEFVTADAGDWLTEATGTYDFAYVDCRPGKYLRLPDLLTLLAPGALYVVDDMNPQPTWPDDHQPRVDGFLRDLPDVPNLRATPMHWASGLVIAART
ncbi:class I SAM-dependent methyltransferase [Streptomyces sp. G1]|uniref:O-methyltransferase n=1 Tax=Streptomyces sp. G1 TaxID=361572 RepID=UPI0020308045|nr:class I SAM-dependent methyltransferase [Streptomyces sp. G1]MCM1964860.1 class I SAM-dependent methyltransferase [Streptomyces sp. G1]